MAIWILAHVRLLSGMRPQVCPQIEIERESFVAKRALEGLLSCMYELMPLELGIVEKALLAALYRANVLSLTMSHQVLTQ